MIRTLILSVLIATPAAAQSACGPREAVAENLTAKYGETQQSIGLASNGTLAEVWANPVTGTWTFMLTTPDGVSCLKASGQAFQVVEAKPVGDPA